MPLDGATLHVLIDNLDTKLKNSRLMKIYQIDRYTIVLHFRLPGKNETLVISADPVYPRIHTTTAELDNPLTPPAFCMLLRKYLEPSRLLAISQLGYDRIAIMKFEGYDQTGRIAELSLILEVMGRQSNIFLVNDQHIVLDAIKRTSDDQNATRVILPGEPYSFPPDQGKHDLHSLPNKLFQDDLRLLDPRIAIWKWLQDSLQGLSKTAAQEIVRRAGLTATQCRADTTADDWTALENALHDFVEEIDNGGKPILIKEGKSDFAGYNLSHVGDKERFSDIDHLVDYYYTTHIRNSEVEKIRNTLKRAVNKHLSRVTKKEQIQIETLRKAEQADHYRQLGELITANFHQIKKGQSQAEVVDYTQPEMPIVTIELDPTRTPSENAQLCFKKYNKAKKSKESTGRQLKKTQQERMYLEGLITHIELADEIETLRDIETELIKEGYVKPKGKKNANPKSKQHRPQNPAQYVSSDGLTILVGRNNRQNDELTLHIAGPNDIWMHTQKIPGSHVIIRREGVIPENTLLEAALLAATFSKASASPKVPVDYTERRHVRKPAGAKPGFVIYDNFKTLLVDPTTGQLPKKLGQ